MKRKKFETADIFAEDILEDLLKKDGFTIKGFTLKNNKMILSNRQAIVKFLLNFFDTTKQTKVIKKVDLYKFGVIKENEPYFMYFIDLMAKYNYLQIKQIEKIESDTGRTYGYYLASPGEKIKQYIEVMVARKERLENSLV